MMSPEDFITQSKRWPLRAQILGCLAFSATIGLGFAFIPWGEALSQVAYAISFLFNGIFARPTATLWALFTVACTGVCLYKKKVWKPTGNFLFAAFMFSIVGGFLSFMAFVISPSFTTRAHVYILSDVAGIVEKQDSLYAEEIRRWNYSQGSEDTQWVGVDMNYLECAAFLDEVHEKRSFDDLNLYVNDARANYSSGQSPRKACSKIMGNRIEQLIVHREATETQHAYYAITTSPFEAK